MSKVQVKREARGSNPRGSYGAEHLLKLLSCGDGGSVDPDPSFFVVDLHYGGPGV